MKFYNSLSGLFFFCAFLASYQVKAQYSCTTALIIQGTGVHFGNTTGVESDGLQGAFCTTSVDYSGQVWYRFTPTAAGVLEVSTDGAFTDWDTKLHVFSGVCGNLLCEDGNDDFFGLQSFVSVPVIGGTTYFIRVSGYNYEAGSYRLEVNYMPAGDFSYGCKDQTACNYNAGADFEDGSCCYSDCKAIVVTPGIYPAEVYWELFEGNNLVVAAGGAPSSTTACLSSCNYSLAMFDSYGDGWNGASWSLIDTYGQTEVSISMQAGDGPVIDEFILASSCEGVLSGCTNPVACNYDIAAQIDDGTCCYGECDHIYVTGGSWPNEVGWIITGAESGVIASAFAPSAAPYAGNICVSNPACDYTVTMLDTYGDGWNNATYTIATEDGTVESTGTLSAGSSGSSPVFNMGDPDYGCNNPQASNYNPAANCTNSTSCVYCFGNSVPYTISVDLSEVSTDLPMIVAIYNEYGLEVFYDDFIPVFDQDYFATVCLAPGCYFLNLEYGFPYPDNNALIAPGVIQGQPSNGRGVVFSEVNWTIAGTNGVIWASGNALGAHGFSVNTFACPLPIGPLQASAAATTCNGNIESISIVGMPNAQLLIRDVNYGTNEAFFLDASGYGVYYTNPVYGFSSYEIEYNPLPQEWFNPSYAYPIVYIQGIVPPTASIVGEGETICEGDQVVITLQGTPNSDARYTIWAYDLDLVYQVFSGSVEFDNSGYAYLYSGVADESLNYYLESVAIGNCLNSDVFDSFFIAVQDPVITEYELSTTANVFCVGDVIEASVDFGDPENPWNPNNPDGGTPGSNYGWYLIEDEDTLNVSFNTTAYSNQVSINLSTSTPGNYRLAVIESTDAGCISPIAEFPIEVRENVLPEFTDIGPYCVGETAAQFPSVSLQGITGSWFPAQVTTDYSFLPDYYITPSYTFTPDAGQCAYGAIEVVPVIDYANTQLTVNGPTTFCEGGQVVISASDALCYRWLGYPGCSSNPQFVATTSGTYWAYVVNIYDGYECSSATDEVVVTVLNASSYYADTDNDGFGNPNVYIESCNPVPGYVSNTSDCDDTDAAINPSAIEVCDGVDNDCDFLIDELPASAIVDCDNNCIHDSNNNGVCDENEQIGCTDPTACNYDSNATTDNGLCIEAGCNVPDACNYNPNAGCDDGSCVFPGCTNPVACNFDSSAGCDDSSCEFPGCTNPVACNFDSTAGCDDSSCEFPGCTDANACNFNASAGCDDSSCEFPGCTDPIALNYDALAGCPNNTCVYEGLGGCTDVMACNYNAAADFDNGSCQYPQAYLDCNGNCINDSNANGICDEQEGCTDPAACNYDASALGDDGSCTYPPANLDCAGNCLNDTDNDGVCDENEVAGCMIEAACNYDAAATDENGSCTFAVIGYDCDGNCIVDTNTNGICDPEEGLGCMNEAACNYDPNANVDNSTCEFPDFGYDCLGNCTLDSDNDGVCDFDEIPGCTDVEACNYNPLATDENGSCAYPQLYLDCDGSCIHDVDGDLVCDELEISGCTDADACNYTADATDDDGSCITQFELDPIIGPLTALTGNSYSYSTSIVEGATYDWTFTPNADCLAPCDGDAITVTFNSAGNYAITVMAVNENYPACSDVVSLVVTVEVPQQVTTLDDKSFCTVYPNPVMHQALLEVTSDWLGSTAELIDATGRAVWSMNVTHGVTTIDMSMHSAGIYSLTLVAPFTGQQRTLRVIKL
ncbi:MAG: T9SS type A sorting domain-containing protein [Flavobacteriales bacterium]|jgi:hypothetical protein